jgi:Tol biopolymer transport system component
MGTRLPQRLLYTMAVILAVLTMLFLILTMALKIPDLLVSSSSSQTKDESRIEATTVENTEDGYDCDGGSASSEVEGLTGKIVYVCNGDIYRMNLATGEIARLTHGAHDPWFDWSPDGEKIAWADQEFGDLWVTDVGGASPSPQGNKSFATSPEWSPDGKTLAFVSAGKPDKWAGLATIPVNSTGFKQKTILSQKEDLDGGSVGSMDWSPDGKKIVFNVDGPPGAKRGLYTINTDGTDLTKISWPKTDPETNVRQNDRYWLGPTYSPDGKRIAFVKGWDDWQIYTINPDGTDARQVTHDAGGYEIQSWSPNGEKILYENLSNGHRDLFVINADGTGRQRLTSVQSSAEDLNRIHNVLWLP